jgi:hypothetical protein
MLLCMLLGFLFKARPYSMRTKLRINKAPLKFGKYSRCASNYDTRVEAPRFLRPLLPPLTARGPPPLVPPRLLPRASLLLATPLLVLAAARAASAAVVATVEVTAVAGASQPPPLLLPVLPAAPRLAALPTPAAAPAPERRSSHEWPLLMP